jgi:hypothetical protein
MEELFFLMAWPKGQSCRPLQKALDCKYCHHQRKRRQRVSVDPRDFEAIGEPHFVAWLHGVSSTEDPINRNSSPRWQHILNDKNLIQLTSKSNFHSFGVSALRWVYVRPDWANKLVTKGVFVSESSTMIQWKFGTRRNVWDILYESKNKLLKYT